MLNYIKAELYRNINRAYLWIFTGIIAAFALFLIVISRSSNVPGLGLTTLVQLSTTVLSIPVFLVAAMIDMVTSEENKNQTMRNAVTFGVPRSQIIISKVITSVILALICAVIIMFILFGSDAILHGLGDDFPGNIGRDFLKILAAVPLWIGAISVGTFLAIVITNNTIASFIYAGLFLLTSNIIKLLTFLVWDKLQYLQDILITTQLKRLADPKLTSGDMLQAVMIGVIYTIVFTTLTVIYFKKKEIK